MNKSSNLFIEVIRLLYYLPMERMSEEEFINNVEGHITSLKNLDNKALKILVGKLEEKNKKLKSDLGECECSFGFESDEVGFWKGEYKRLKKWIKDHCKGYGNLFPEDEMKRQRKKADKKRK